MAIIKRYSNSKGTRWQVKVRDGSGEYFPTQTFTENKAARIYESSLVKKRLEGKLAKKSTDNINVREFFEAWVHRLTKISEGWRRDRIRDYRNFVDPFIGDMKMKQVRPVDVADILKKMHDLGKAPQTQLHIFNLLRKLFNDAIEDSHILRSSPVLRKFKPILVKQERPHLNVQDSRRLLEFVKGKPFELMVWINLVMGNRVGEILALKWQDIDFQNGEILVRSTYCRKEKRIKDYPKGGKQYRVTLQSEVVEKLKSAFQNQSSEFVCPGSDGLMMSYHVYYWALKKYCQELGIAEVATHGLRHSTSAIWAEGGATKEDMQNLFNHSSPSVTERYLHGTNDRLSSMARTLRLIKNEDAAPAVPISVPKLENLDLDEVGEA